MLGYKFQEGYEEEDVIPRRKPYFFLSCRNWATEPVAAAEEVWFTINHPTLAWMHNLWKLADSLCYLFLPRSVASFV
jgi:hypothetical protein